MSDFQKYKEMKISVYGLTKHICFLHLLTFRKISPNSFTLDLQVPQA